MSAATAATWAAVAVAGAGLINSVAQGQQQQSAQRNAQRQAKENADKAAGDASAASNRANQKSPDTSAILSAAQQAGLAGQSGTMLTGSSGVDSSSLSTGKTTLFGS